LRGGRLATALVPVLVLRAPSPAAAQTPTNAWNANVGVHASWYNDPFSGTPGQPGYVEGIRMGLGYTMNNPLTQMAFDAYGMGTFAQGTGGTDHINYAGAFAVTHHATSRLTLRFSEAVVSLYANGAPLLAADGLIYPLTVTRTNDVDGGFTYQFTPRTSATVSARHTYAGFDGTPGLTNGWQFRTNASLARQLSATDTVDVTYSYRLSEFQGDPAKNTDTNSLTAGWTRQVSEYFSFSADLGVSHIHRANTTSEYGFVADAALTHKLQRGNISLRYSHGFSQAYGFGRDRLYDTVGLVYSRPMTRNLSATALGVYGRSTDPFDPLYGFDTQNYNLGLQYVLARGWVLGGSYGWLYRSQVGTPSRSTHNVNASLTYGWEWR
jgi:hypothetical protein